MTLTGAQLSRIHQAILPAYTYDELRRVVLAGMNVEFSHHVSPEKAYSDQIFEFVTWANRQGRALELLRCAAEGNERNEGLQALWAEAQTWSALLQPSKTPEPPTSPAAPHHVFLAYSRKDAAIMRRLRSDLLAAGIVAWIDQEDLEPGTPVWQRTIEGAIRNAKCAVVILTPDAKESEWVNNEISRAKRTGIPIFPVLAGGDEADAVPLILETTNHVDIRTDYAGAVQGKLIPALCKHLGMTDAAKPVLRVSSKYLEGDRSSRFIEKVLLRFRKGAPIDQDVNAVNAAIVAQEYCKEQLYHEALAELRNVAATSSTRNPFALYDALQVLLDIEQPTLLAPRPGMMDITIPLSRDRDPVWNEIVELMEVYHFIWLGFRCQTHSRQTHAIAEAVDLLNKAKVRVESDSRLDICKRGILLRVIMNWHIDLRSSQLSTISPVSYSPAKNPFVYDVPIRPPTPLHGCKRAMQELADAWDGAHFHVTAITGPLLSGKTSLYFAGREQLPNPKTKNPLTKLHVYVTLKHLSTKNLPPISRIAYALFDVLSPLVDGTLVDAGEIHREPLHVIDTMVRNICERIDVGLIIGLDDFDYLESVIEIQAELEEFLGFMFHLCEIIPNFSMVLISTESRGRLYNYDLLRDIRAVRTVRVDFLGSKRTGEFADVLQHPNLGSTHRFTEAAIKRIQDLTGGQPYLVQLIAWAVVDTFNKNYFYFGSNTSVASDIVFEPLFDLEDVDRILTLGAFRQGANYYRKRLAALFSGDWRMIEEILDLYSIDANRTLRVVDLVQFFGQQSPPPQPSYFQDLMQRMMAQGILREDRSGVYSLRIPLLLML